MCRPSALACDACDAPTPDFARLVQSFVSGVPAPSVVCLSSQGSALSDTPSEDLRDRVNRNRYAQRRRHVAQRVEPGPALRGNHHLVARLQLQLIEGAACCDRPPQRIALPYRLTVAGDLQVGELDRKSTRLNSSHRL